MLILLAYMQLYSNSSCKVLDSRPIASSWAPIRTLQTSMHVGLHVHVGCNVFNCASHRNIACIMPDILYLPFVCLSHKLTELKLSLHFSQIR